MSSPVLGVVVPCRNEARVVRRKLANLARLEWPKSERPHAIVIVDDGSVDGTEAAADDAARALFTDRNDVRVLVSRNAGTPGKAGAISSGLDGLGREVDLVVLSDADVVFEERALRVLLEAFEDEELAMACGAQVFVRDLADDGSPRAADGGLPARAEGFFDRFTGLVRRLESRSGRLFSVHGQLLAWRSELGLRPSPGVAADDLDLVLGVRGRGLPCRLVDGARFLEVKTPADRRGAEQARRRARAYFQAVLRPGLSLGTRPGDRLQWWFYTRVPARAPELLAAVVLVGLTLTLMTLGPLWAVVLIVATGLLCFTPFGRELLFLARVIATTRRREDHAELSDRWEMERP